MIPVSGGLPPGRRGLPYCQRCRPWCAAGHGHEPPRPGLPQGPAYRQLIGRLRTTLKALPHLIGSALPSQCLVGVVVRAWFAALALCVRELRLPSAFAGSAHPGPLLSWRPAQSARTEGVPWALIGRFGPTTSV